MPRGLPFGWLGNIVSKNTPRFISLSAMWQRSNHGTKGLDTIGGFSKQYLKGDLEALEHTELFESNLIKHIFNGEVKTASAGKGKTRLEATGYHTEVIRNAEGRIIPGTKSELNEKGVYQGRVTVNGIRKRTMGGMSTFFPEHWSPQHIVNAINEAYANKRFKTNTLNMYEGSSSEGVRIRMRVNANGKIVNVYPLMEEN